MYKSKQAKLTKRFVLLKSKTNKWYDEYSTIWNFTAEKIPGKNQSVHKEMLFTDNAALTAYNEDNLQ